MNLVLIFFVTLFGSCLTFFSGFGLGTIILPLFLVFFAPELAIPAAALVHFSNSIFKFVYVFRYIHFPILIRFGIPAVLAAFLGAELLKIFGELPEIYSYTIQEHTFHVSGINFMVGCLIILFTWFESSNRIKNIQFKGNHLILGGVLSGFFGGLSGHQGALRSLFLKKTPLTKEQLVGTSNAISLGIDIVRIVIYLQMISLTKLFEGEQKYFIGIGIAGAFLGASLGNKLLKKVTLSFVQKIISVLLFIFGLLLILGII